MTDCVDCDGYAVEADDSTSEIEQGDPRGTQVTRWGPQLIAPYDKPTGDKRRFAAGALTNRDLPIPVKWQRQDDQGHKSSVVVGTVDQVEPREDGVYGAGLLFDPDPEQLPRLAQDVAEVRELSRNGVLGPSVDLDDMEFHALADPDAGELAAGEPEKRPEIEVTRGRISAITLVPIPAFAEVGPLQFSTMPAEEYSAMVEALTASVNSAGWSAMPIAPPGTDWDAGAAQQRIKAWADGDIGKYGRAFLWCDDMGQSEKMGDYKFPIADVIGGDLKIVPKAVQTASGVLNGAMGGTAIPAADQARMKSLLAKITKRFDPDNDGDDDRSPDTDTDDDKGKMAASIGVALALMDYPSFAAVAAAAEDLVSIENEKTFGARFEKLKARLAGHVSDPDAVAAEIGRRKYGAKGMAKLVAGVAAKKVRPLAAGAGREALEAMTAASLTGYWGSISEESAMVASGATATAQRPTKAMFEVPEAGRVTPLTYGEPINGLTPVYGHLADWNSCHTGLAGCTKPPKSPSKYAYFHTGARLTQEGEIVPVGRVSIGGGHAHLGMGFQAAAAHYDNSTTTAAYGRATDGKHGIWFSGYVVPGMEDDLLAHPPSGDWRPIGGRREMIHALAVNSPGFPVPREAMTAGASGELEEGALVAAGIVLPDTYVPPQETVDVMQVAREAARAVLEEQASFARRAKAQQLLTQMDDDADDAETVKRRKRGLAAVAAMVPSSGYGK